MASESLDKKQILTLGAGRFYVSREGNSGETYLGSSDGFSLGITTETKLLETSRLSSGLLPTVNDVHVEGNGLVTLRSISTETLSLFLGSSVVSSVQSESTEEVERIEDIALDRWHQLGLSRDLPFGHRDVSNVRVLGLDGVEFDFNIDFSVDERTGRLFILPSGGIPAGATINVEYEIADSTRLSMSSTGTFRIRGPSSYIEDSDQGASFYYRFINSEIFPNGLIQADANDNVITMVFGLRCLAGLSGEPMIRSLEISHG